VVGVLDYRIDSPQSGYTVPAEQGAATYAYCRTRGYVEQVLRNLAVDLGSEVNQKGMTPEDLERLLEQAREKEFRARYGA
jgi:hypothetical protein